VVLSADGRVSQPGKAWLAGSSASMEHCVSCAAKFTGLPLADILPMASAQPAGYIGLPTAGRVVADWDAAECRLSNLKVYDA
jgi:N-acetylglucosamine-6-phosphate deacetylase